METAIVFWRSPYSVSEEAMSCHTPRRASRSSTTTASFALRICSALGPSQAPRLGPYLDARGTYEVGLVMGLMGLLMAYYGGLRGIKSGVTKSTDHPSRIEGPGAG